MKYKLKNGDEIFFEAETLEEIEQADKNWTGFNGELIGLNLYEDEQFTGKTYNTN